MKSTRIKTEKITVESKIPFTLLNDKYGREMFDFCLIFKRGYLREIFIQQHINTKRFVFTIPKGYKITTFSIGAWIHRTSPPYTWREFWCKEHKTICHQVYAPNNTNTITFQYHFGDSIDIRFEGGKEND